MASKKQHPHIGKFVAMYAGATGYDERPLTYDTAEEALEDFRLDAANGAYTEGTVVYVYAVVGVKEIKKPTLTESLVEDQFA